MITRTRSILLRRRLVGMALLAVAISAVGTVSACGGSDPTTQPSPTRSSTEPTTTPGPAGSAAPISGPYAPAVDSGAFTATVDNPYFPLPPGARWDYRASTEDGVETTVVQVTSRTRTVMGVQCVEVRDTVRLNGRVIEDTRDWYAQHRDGTVWYFGEATAEYKNGGVASTKGSWEAGVHGAQPGIVMPASHDVGDRYRQEYYRDQAEDVAEILAVAERVQVPTGSYDGVLKTKEITRLEPTLLENKYYARGVGPVLTVDVAEGTRDELIRFTIPR